MIREPDWRIREATSWTSTSEDSWVCRLRLEVDHPDIQAALAIYHDDNRRGIVEGYTLAEVDAAGIRRRFAIDLPVLNAYWAIAFDLTGYAPGDRALLAQDPEVPRAVRHLRCIGLSGPLELDHHLGLVTGLPVLQRRELEDRIMGRLLGLAAQSESPVDWEHFLATFVALRPSPSESTGEDVKVTLRRLVTEMLKKVRHAQPESDDDGQE